MKVLNTIFIIINFIGFLNGQSSVRLNGTGKYVEIPHIPAYEALPLSIEFWILVENTNADPAGEQTIIDKRQDGKGYNVRLAGKTFPLPCFSFWEPQNELHDFLGLEHYQWTHYAYTITKEKTKIYKNGALVAERITGTYDSKSKAPLRIGEFLGYPGGSLPFIGQIDEFRMWSKELSPSEIIDRMHKLLTGNETGLMLYLNFESTGGGTAFDMSRNKNDGKIFGAPTKVTPGAPVGYIPLPAPKGSFAYGVNDGIMLQWEKVSNAKSYKIFRDTTSAFFVSNSKLIGETSDNIFKDGSSVKGRIYFYKIVAYDIKDQVGLSTGTMVGKQRDLVDFNTGVYYYPWYQPEKNHHPWEGAYLRGRLTPAQLPILGEYSSNSAPIIKQHLTWMEENSINYLISSWWGQESLEDLTLKNRILPEIINTPIQFCLYFESGMYANPQFQIELNDQNINFWLQDMEYIADTYFKHPNYLKIDGRPVLYIYLSHIYSGKYKEAYLLLRQRLQTKGHHIFLIGDFDMYAPFDPKKHEALDGLSPYIAIPGGHQYINQEQFPNDYDFLRNMGLQMHDKADKIREEGKLFIANVYPGFNNRVVSLQTGFLVPRQLSKSHAHHSLFEGMAKISRTFTHESQNHLTITSWNEWHEDTNIEPIITSPPTSLDNSSNESYSRGYLYEGYGHTFLDLTKNLLGKGIATNIIEKTSDSDLKVYPNPASEIIRIRTKTSNQVMKVEIMDINGKKLISKDVQNEENIDISNLKSGIYLLKVIKGQTSEIWKWLKN